MDFAWLRRLLGAVDNRGAGASGHSGGSGLGSADVGPVVLGQPPMIYQGKAQYPVHEIVLHTTATGPDWWKGKTADQMMAEVREWHKARGWRREGYHFLVAPDGSTADGRPFTEIGAHVKERNRGTIGPVLVPIRTVRTDRLGRFEDYYTEAQRATLRRKIAAIAAMTQLKWISGHNDYAAKTCPGFQVEQEEWMP